MSTPIITLQGLGSLLTYNGTVLAWLQTLTLHLYQNNHTPAVTDTLAAYTEATFDGYGSAALSSFSGPTPDANHNEQYTAPQINFVMTGSTTPNTVYGFYWTDASGHLAAAQDNGGGFVMSGPGFEYSVVPNFYAGQILTPL